MPTRSRHTMDVVNTNGKPKTDGCLYLFGIRHADLSEESANVDEQVEVLIVRSLS
jgi:hypothetical protein